MFIRVNDAHGCIVLGIDCPASSTQSSRICHSSHHVVGIYSNETKTRIGIHEQNNRRKDLVKTYTEGNTLERRL